VPRPAVWTIIGSVLAGFAAQGLPSHLAERLVAEKGLVENTSALLYLAGLIIALLQLFRGLFPSSGKRAYRVPDSPDQMVHRSTSSPIHRFSAHLPWLCAAGVLLWLLLRELDFQKAFTYRSIESIGFYTHPRAPVWQKLVAIGALTPFALALLCLFWIAWRNARQAIAQRQPWLGYCAGVIALGLLSAACEKLLDLQGAEEICELGLALLVLLLTRHIASVESQRRSQLGLGT